MRQQDLKYWQELAERYFLAETSEEEERLLRRFLCTEEAQDSRFDEIRATISFIHAGRQNHRAHSLGQGVKVACIAACLCGIAFMGWHLHQQNACTVRIAGKRVEANATELMEKQMADMFSPPANRP